MTDQWRNKLYFGDNLDIMRRYIEDESVDLIYLDPPFNSNSTYNVLFSERNGSASSAQITAFEDTWHWDLKAEETYREVVSEGPRKLADLLQALRTFLGTNDMMAYLTMMAVRLVQMHRVLKPTGSIYLHCDPTASHYLKVVLDAVFGPANFRNEIIWKRSPFSGSSKSRARFFPRNHDTLFMYTKTDVYTFHPQLIPYSEDYKARFKNPDGDPRGPWQSVLLKTYSDDTLKRLKQEGRLIEGGSRLRYKFYLNEAPGGRPQNDLWIDDGVMQINPVAKERLGYPTQKPEALLERIIRASSNEEDLVLDPFCGCGTAVAVAERLHRRWIGIDITHLAVSLMRHRLEDSFGSELSEYEVVGDPKDLKGAEALAQLDRFQFEWWALGLVKARPAQDKKKGADSGIDGIINFFDDNSGKAKKIVVQVKSGHVTRNQIATLNSDREREGAEIGAFITLEEPTGPMRTEAASAGFYEPEFFPGTRYPRIQILTIEELLSGKKLEYPRVAPEATFKRAERKSKELQSRQKELW